MSILYFIPFLISFICSSIEEKKISVVVPSYNNEKYIDPNLGSIVNQNYKNFEIIYVNDSSKDDTLKKAYDFLSKYSKVKYTIVNQTINRKPSFSRWHGINLCDRDDIVVLVDGDDWLPHTNILKQINEIYSKENIWSTYGSYQTSSGQVPNVPYKIPKRILDTNSFRTYGFVSTHLRTFYAWLYKEIPLKKLLYNNQFVPMAADVTEGFCLLELSNGKFKFIEEIMYIYNNQNILNEDKISAKTQMEIYQNISRQAKLLKLTEKPSSDIKFLVLEKNQSKNFVLSALQKNDFITFSNNFDDNLRKNITSKMAQTKAFAFLPKEMFDISMSIDINLSNDTIPFFAKYIKQRNIKFDANAIYNCKLLYDSIKKLNFNNLHDLIDRDIYIKDDIILHI